MLIEIQFYGIARSDEKILLGFKRKDTGKVAIVITTNSYDAGALSDALQVRRDTIPNIYDTWADSMRKLGVVVDGLVVGRIIDDQIECRLHFTHGNTHCEVPCGLSEGTNIALRMNAPLHADAQTLDEVAVLAEIANETISPDNDDLPRN